MNDIGASESIVQGRQLEKGFDVGCDAVVVGSGAGGAVVAATLAEAGLEVIVLEEGAYYRPEEYGAFRPSESLRRLGRESGMIAALGLGQTPIIALMAGRCVGGSSVMTGGVCFRIPSHVHDHWEQELGLDELGERGLEAAYAAVERRCHIGEVPRALRSRSTQRFVDGAGELGIPMYPLNRNTDGCEGNARCNFGCPKGAKMSVDVSYLPGALEHGARVVSDALVERVVFDRDRATGVEGRLLGGEHGAPGHRFRVRAPLVIVACGTIHTPGLLAASGLGGPDLGRHITLHPAVRVAALFDDRLDGWNGALQSVYSDHFHDDGITLVGVYSTVNVLAGAFPGVGPSLRRRIETMPYMGIFGAMIHDQGGGVVRPGIGTREPMLSYNMVADDLRRLRRSFTILSRDRVRGRSARGVRAGVRRAAHPLHGRRLEGRADEDRRAPHRVHGLPPARQRAHGERRPARRGGSERRVLRHPRALRRGRFGAADQHRRQLAGAGDGHGDADRVGAPRAVRLMARLHLPIHDAARFVLVGPHYPENVGAAARALKTMGFSRLLLVKPGRLASPGHEMARKMAVKSLDVLEAARVCDSLAEALDGVDLVFATTSRRGVSGVLVPRDAARMAELTTERGGQLAFVFGNEKTGLSQADLARCRTSACASRWQPRSRR